MGDGLDFGVIVYAGNLFAQSFYQTLHESDMTEDDAGLHVSLVFLPRACIGGVKSTRYRREAALLNASAEITRPGAMDPPRKSEKPG